MQWLRALSESDCYLRCYGDKTGTVDVVNSIGWPHDHPATRLKLDPALKLESDREEHQPEQPAEAA